MNYELRKGRDGWEAKSVVPYGEGHTLRISTGKTSRGGLSTSVTRVKEDGDGCYSFMMFADYSKAFAVDRSARCTEKSVRLLHEESLARFDEIKADVDAFYAAKGAA